MNLAIEDRTSVQMLRDADGHLVAQCLYPKDAQRIAACVNACEDVDTGNLHSGDMHELIMDLDAVRRRHDALVAAAKEAVHVISGCYGVDSAAYHAIDRLAAVLHELDHDAP